MKTIDLVERIEGEAKLNCTWQDGIISDAQIDFLNFRGFEYILQDKEPLDALVYTPRICGICGQAHLKACVEALEDIYINNAQEVNLTPKAKLLREIGLNIEIIDSHIKWFCMFILPDIIKLDTNDLGDYTPLNGQRWKESAKTTSELIKALAIIGGQWPHTSYMIPGGVVSDPTLLDLVSMTNYLDESIRFFENKISGVSLDDYLCYDNNADLEKLQSDLKYFKNLAFKYDLQNQGKSYSRFISLGSDSIFKSGKYIKRISHILDYSKIKEHTQNSFILGDENNNKNKHTWSKAVTYKNNFYETGPLSRAIINNNSFIKSLYKEYEDSVFTRVMARVNEIALLLHETKNLIKQIDISQESFIPLKMSLKDLEEGNGKSFVEATRGSLHHNIKIKKGRISSYDIITPTVWNLSPQHNKKLGVAQKAIIGTSSLEIAKIVLRSFDVCSVCTTH